MQYSIHGNEYTYSSEVSQNPEVQESFHLLTEKVYGFRLPGLSRSYIPHVLMQGGRVVSNISVNRMQLLADGQQLDLIQLGTVMTDPDFRGRGLSRWLMERVLWEWEKNCCGVYLFANDSVLNFYPKFGFAREREYECRKTIYPRPGGVRRLDMNNAADRRLLFDRYMHSNPFSALSMQKNIDILWFYCSGELKQNIYYSEDCNAVAILDYSPGRLLCYDIFCGEGPLLEGVLSFLVREPSTVTLGFFPKAAFLDGWSISSHTEEDTTLFVWGKKDNPMSNRKLMFPLLSHA